MEDVEEVNDGFSIQRLILAYPSAGKGGCYSRLLSTFLQRAYEAKRADRDAVVHRVAQTAAENRIDGPRGGTDFFFSLLLSGTKKARLVIYHSLILLVASVVMHEWDTQSNWLLRGGSPVSPSTQSLNLVTDRSLTTSFGYLAQLT